MKCLLETFEPEKEVADEIAGDEQKNVVEGQEVWEAATCAVTSAGVKPMLATIREVTAEATLTAVTSMLETRKAVIAVIAKAATAAETTEFGGSSSRQRNFQTEERLNIEIESIRRLMMKLSQK